MKPPGGPRGGHDERHPVVLAAEAEVPLALDATRVLRVADQAGDAEAAALLDVAAALGLPPEREPRRRAFELLAEVAGAPRRLRLPGQVVTRHLPLTAFRSVPPFLRAFADRRGIVALFVLDDRVGLLVDVERLAQAGGEGA